MATVLERAQNMRVWLDRGMQAIAHYCTPIAANLLYLPVNTRPRPTGRLNLQRSSLTEAIPLPLRPRHFRIRCNHTRV
jgi:hypothetical protein